MRMRWLVGLLLAGLLIISSVLVSAQADETNDIQENIRLAETAYASGDYVSAAQFYEAAIASVGNPDAVPPELFYNLASAYFEADDLGLALVNALRAQQEMPRNNDLARLLALIRALRVDVLGDETALIDNIAGVTIGLLTINELTVITFVLWCLAFGLMLLRLLRPAFRRLSVFVVVVGGISVLALVLLLGRGYVETVRLKAVVTAFTTEALSGPGEDYVPLFTLYNAAEGRILENEAGYVRLLLPDGRQGWLPAQEVKVLQ